MMESKSNFKVVIIIFIFITSISTPLSASSTIGLNETHAKISINGDSDLLEQALLNNWPGNGSIINPIIIKDLVIDYALGEHIPSESSGIAIESTRLAIQIKNIKFILSNNEEPTVSNHGIKITNSSNILLQNCEIIDFLLIGVFILNSTNVEVQSSEFHHNDDFVKIEGFEPDGIWVFESNNIMITQNNLESVSAGIRVVRSQEIEINNNDIIANWVAVNLQGYSRDIELVNNNFKSSGITVFDTLDGFTSKGDTVNGKPLLFIKDTGNVITSDDYGQIFIINAHNVELHSLDIANASDAIVIFNSTDISITDSEIHNNQLSGITIESTNHSVFENNMYANNRYGMKINTPAEFNNITDNIFESNEYGIYFYIPDTQMVIRNNSIESNKFRDNLAYIGVYPNYYLISDVNEIKNNVVIFGDFETTVDGIERIDTAKSPLSIFWLIVPIILVSARKYHQRKYLRN